MVAKIHSLGKGSQSKRKRIARKPEMTSCRRAINFIKCNQIKTWLALDVFLSAALVVAIYLIREIDLEEGITLFMFFSVVIIPSLACFVLGFVSFYKLCANAKKTQGKEKYYLLVLLFVLFLFDTLLILPDLIYNKEKLSIGFILWNYFTSLFYMAPLITFVAIFLTQKKIWIKIASLVLMIIFSLTVFPSLS